jgi:hypothetical protein
MHEKGGGAVALPSRLYHVGFCSRYRGKSRHPSTAFKATRMTHSDRLG